MECEWYRSYVGRRYVMRQLSQRLQADYAYAPFTLATNRLSDFSKILHTEAEWHSDRGHVTQTTSFENSRWRTAAILKIVKSPYLNKKIIRL